MLTKEEMKEFLAMLLAFAGANRLSAAMVSKLLGVSRATAARWMKAARAGEVTSLAPCYIAHPALDKLNKLNKFNDERGIFQAIENENAAEKVAKLQSALDGRIVW